MHLSPRAKAICTAIVALAVSALCASAQVLTFEEAKQRADQGDAFAQAVVALHYQLGWNTQKNPEIAAKYAIASAEAGHPYGIFRLGALYVNGEGVEKNPDLGYKLQAQAGQGLIELAQDRTNPDPYAMTAVGIANFQGKVTPQNRARAVEWYKVAASYGFAPAIFNYIMCEIEGQGLPKHPATYAHFVKQVPYSGSGCTCSHCSSPAIGHSYPQLLADYPPAKHYIAENIANFENNFQSAADLNGTLPLEAEHCNVPQNQETVVSNSAVVTGAPVPQDAYDAQAQALALDRQGRNREALPLWQRAVALCETSVGPHNVATADMLNYLGRCHESLGEYKHSLAAFKRALSIVESNLGESHPETALLMNNLSVSYENLGDYAAALPLKERAYSSYQKSLGDNNPDTALALTNLGYLYQLMNNYEKALPLHKRALGVLQSSLGSEHHWTTVAKQHLAKALSGLGYVESALELNRDVLAARERIFGPAHKSTIVAMDDLAGNLVALGRFDEAISLYKRSLEGRENLFGPGHRDTATTWFLLGWAYEVKRDFANAMSAYDKAIPIIEANNRRDPVLRSLFFHKAIVAYMSGDTELAASVGHREAEGFLDKLRHVAYFDEETRLSWQKANSNRFLANVLQPGPLADYILGSRGFVLDSQMQDRRLALAAERSGEDKGALREIDALRSKIAKIFIESGNTPEAAALRNQIAELQRKALGELYAGAARVGDTPTLSMADVVPALGDRSVLLQLIYFSDPKLSKQLLFWGDDPESACYGAIITTSNGVSSFVRLGSASLVDEGIDKLRSAITSGEKLSIESKTRTLSEALWQPIADHIPPGTRRLIISPEAKLNFLSFGTLLEADGSFVAENYATAYIGSGRDLARKPSGEAARNLVVFADPVFDASGKTSPAEEMVAMRSAEADVFGAINLPPLPGTKVEAEQLKIIAAGAGWDIKTTTGDEATESSVRGAKKPGVLHLATHGFYLNSFTPSAEDGTRGMSVVGLNKDKDNKPKESGVDPMRASGVALTGAQETLKLWSQRKAPEPETDGILTAEEVASLDLNGTWLVTLSACETGVGEARSGEGVFGLRRAFMMAGAENLLMTLWPVADDTTASIMADFYKEALATGDAPGSLAKVQRDWLVKLREEKGLATAIREAGPFAMVMMTAPTHPPIELPSIAKNEAAGDSNNQQSEESTTEKKSGWWPF